VKNVIVVGFARSGTSLTAAIFARNGYFAAQDSADLRSADRHNASGYWESQPLVEANASLFRRVGYSEHNTWTSDRAITKAEIAALRELEPDAQSRELVERFCEHSPWVWKDPRLCYTLGYWWRLVPRSDTVAVVVRRDPGETYASFRRIGGSYHGGRSRAEVDQRIDDALTAAMESIRSFDIPHIEIGYHEYAEDPRSVVDRIRGATGLTLEPEQLGYSAQLNHSTPIRFARGRAGTLLRVVARRVVPPPLRRRLKQMA
jgi:hypothetical protein